MQPANANPIPKNANPIPKNANRLFKKPAALAMLYYEWLILANANIANKSHKKASGIAGFIFANGLAFCNSLIISNCGCPANIKAACYIFAINFIQIVIYWQ